MSVRKNRPTQSTEELPIVPDRAEPAREPSESPAGEAGTETVPSAIRSGPPISAPPPTEAPAPEQDRDPFDPARLRITQDFGASLGIRKVLTRVPVDKPRNNWWVRAHPDPEYRLQTFLMEPGDDRERYLIDPSLWSALAGEPTVFPAMLITSVTRQGVPFLWPIKLPGPDGRPNPWYQSALDASERARSSWVRVYANMALGAYSVDESTAIRDEPDWPLESFRELLSIAFRDRLIREWDHPVLKQLRGEA